MADIALGTAATTAPAEEVSRQLAAIEGATGGLLASVDHLDELSVRQPSLLPGWSRAHVITHLARNADAFANLLLWARTGIEHPMYTSEEDRNEAIAEGATRPHRVMAEDLAASCQRLAHAARTMPGNAWTVEIADAAGDLMPAHYTLRLRLLEVWVHLVDLDHDTDFDDIPPSDQEQLLEDVVQQFGGRPDVPALSLAVDFGDHRRSWDLRGTTAAPSRVLGGPGAMLGWLLGRTGTDDLHGDFPELPDWL